MSGRVGAGDGRSASGRGARVARHATATFRFSRPGRYPIRRASARRGRQRDRRSPDGDSPMRRTACARGALGVRAPAPRGGRRLRRARSHGPLSVGPASGAGRRPHERGHPLRRRPLRGHPDAGAELLRRRRPGSRRSVPLRRASSAGTSATGALELVAYGDLRREADPENLLVRGAQNPSISRDGRWVAFSTGAALVPQDTNGNVDVYVRDMSRPITAPRTPSSSCRRATAATRRPSTRRAVRHRPPGREPGARRHAAGRDERRRPLRRSSARRSPPATCPPRPAPMIDAGQVYVRDRIDQAHVLLTRYAHDRRSGRWRNRRARR